MENAFWAIPAILFASVAATQTRRQAQPRVYGRGSSQHRYRVGLTTPNMRERLFWENPVYTANVEVKVARPPRSDYSIFDKARESWLKN